MVGSGISKQNLLIAFVKKEVGSGIRCFFTPRIRDGAMVGSGIQDKTSRIRNTDTIFLAINYRHTKIRSFGKRTEARSGSTTLANLKWLVRPGQGSKPGPLENGKVTFPIYEEILKILLTDF
jgi:hypothetical protein